MSSTPPILVPHAPRARLRRALSWGLIAGPLGLMAVAAAGGEAPAKDDLLVAIVGVVFFAGFSLISLLGFRRYLPESIGGTANPARGDEARRWRGFLRIACGWLLTMQGIVGVALVVDRSDGETLVSTLKDVGLIAAWMVLSALTFGLLGKAVGAAGTPTPGGPVHSRSAFERVGAFLSPGVSLRSGSLMVLVTLMLVTSADYGCSTWHYRGHEIVRRKADWITAQNLDPRPPWSRVPPVPPPSDPADDPRSTAPPPSSPPDSHGDERRALTVDETVLRTVSEIDRAMYVVALALALFTLALTARRRDLDARLLLWCRGVSGAVALWTVSDLACFWILGADQTRPVALVAWLLVWLVPPLLWARRGLSDAPHALERWRGLRAFLVVMWLPIVTVAYLTVAIVGDIYGYVAFFFAVQLLWWGHLTQPAKNAAPSPSGPAALAAAVP